MPRSTPLLFFVLLRLILMVALNGSKQSVVMGHGIAVSTLKTCLFESTVCGSSFRAFLTACTVLIALDKSS